MSIRSVCFLPEQKAKDIEPALDQAMISITNPGHKAALSPNWRKLFRVEFVDGEYWKDALESAGNARFGLYASCIQELQAQEIVYFIGDIANESMPYDLFVHCWAGQRRSGAVARYVAERFGVPIAPTPSQVNKTVYELLNNPAKYSGYFETKNTLSQPSILRRIGRLFFCS